MATRNQIRRWKAGGCINCSRVNTTKNKKCAVCYETWKRWRRNNLARAREFVRNYDQKRLHAPEYAQWRENKRWKKRSEARTNRMREVQI